MDVILKQLEINLNSIKDEHNKSIQQIQELEEKNNIIVEENNRLKNTIEELNKEKKAKTSSTIWESMNAKLSEKDTIIEQLKKDIEFYKRTGTKTNIAEKWQSTISKSNEKINIQLSDKLVEKTFNTIKNNCDIKKHIEEEKEEEEEKIEEKKKHKSKDKTKKKVIHHQTLQ